MIRRFAWLFCIALFLVCHTANADARAIVDRAIEFAGGRDALARYEKPFVRFAEGVALGGGEPSQLKIEITIMYPDKVRTHRLSKGGATLDDVFNGEKGWQKSAAPQGKTVRLEMIAMILQFTRDRVYSQWLSTLLPLDDKAFRLSTVREIEIDDRPAVGVNVSRDDRPDVQLYFDKETFALLKLARKTNNRLFEEYYDDYASLDGLRYPKKLVHYANGNKTVEMQTTELKFLDTLEDTTFHEP